MKFTFSILLSLFIFLNSYSQTNEELSISFVKKLERQQFDSCYSMFDTSMANKFNATMLEKMWGSIPRYMGEYKGYTTVESMKKDSIDVVAIRCTFEKTKMDLQLVYNSPPQKIIGMCFTQPKSKTAYLTPDYAEQSKYYETKIAVKTGPTLGKFATESARLALGKSVKVQYKGYIKIIAIGFIPIKVKIDETEYFTKNDIFKTPPKKPIDTITIKKAPKSIE